MSHESGYCRIILLSSHSLGCAGVFGRLAWYFRQNSAGQASGTDGAGNQRQQPMVCTSVTVNFSAEFFWEVVGHFGEGTQVSYRLTVHQNDITFINYIMMMSLIYYIMMTSLIHYIMMTSLIYYIMMTSFMYSLVMWHQPEATRKLYTYLWVFFIGSLLLPNSYIFTAIGEYYIIVYMMITSCMILAWQVWAWA